VDVAALRERWTTTYRVRRDQALDLVDRIPILGRFVNEFIRIEFIDRCMLIAAQGLLALIPMLVVLAAFVPNLIGEAVDSFSQAAGVGHSGETMLENQVTIDQVRTQTGIVGLAITIFSATSFARAIQRMHERVWEQPHVGGISGARRCLLWLIGWMVTLQLLGGLSTLLTGFGGLLGSGLSLAVRGLALALIWWVTGWLLLFGRVPWVKLALGALIIGYAGVIYNQGSSLLMPHYVQANAQQLGTLGIILAISTWLIGFAAIMVAGALIGRVVSEDPTVLRLVSGVWRSLTALWLRLRGQQQEDEPAAR
jgi:membrane protein